MYFEDFSRTKAVSAPAHAAETVDLPVRDPLVLLFGLNGK